MIKNTKEHYGSVAKFFHWIIAFLMIGMLALGFIMQGKAVVNVHQLIGFTIFVLAVCRLIWKLINPSTVLPHSLLKIEKIAAKTVQALMYPCMFAMPISGWMMSTAYGLIPHFWGMKFPMPGIENDQDFGHAVEDVHNTLAIVLIILIFMHVMGALKHHFIDKDPTILKSMLPSCKK